MTTVDCPHTRLTRGRDVPLAYGSLCSEVCRDCGAWRTYGHHKAAQEGRRDLRWDRVSDWRPASEYEAATTDEERQ